MSESKRRWWGKTLDLETRAVDGPAVGVIPPARSIISNITVDQALSIGAVYRCVSVITSAVSQMPLGVYRNSVEIDSPAIIKNPNVDESQRQFVKQTVFSLATTGNAYWRVYGSPVANLEVLDPNSVTVVRDPKTGRKTYWIGPDEVRNIKHLRLETKPGEVKGYGPIQHGQSELIGALRVRGFADNWFGGSGVPTGILRTDQPINGDEAQALADAFKEFVNRNDGTAVVPYGLEWQFLNIKPSEAQYLEVQQAQTVAIARLFGVPPTLLGSGNEGTSNTYTNQQELFIQFLQTTLVDYMNEIEDAFTSLLPRGQSVNFKEDALLRMNTVMQTEVDTAQIAAGIRTANEVRQRDGLEPLAAPVAPTAPINEEEDEPND